VKTEFDASHLRFQYESFGLSLLYDYEVRNAERSLRKQQPVLGGYDPSQYVSERLHATAPYGTRVPLRWSTAAIRRSMVCPAPSLWNGSYGIFLPVNFSSNRRQLALRWGAMSLTGVASFGFSLATPASCHHGFHRRHPKPPHHARLQQLSRSN